MAQIEKGNSIIGGSAGVNRLTDGTSKYHVTNIRVNPVYGKFITDHFLLGGSADFNTEFYWGRRAYISLKAGPLARYYFGDMFFVQGDYSFGNYNRVLFEQDLYGRLGRAFFLNNSVAIEPYLFAGYRDIFTRRSSSGGTIDYGIYFSIQVYLEPHWKKQVRKVKQPVIK